MKELTRAEEQIMQVMWQIGKGFVNDILEQLPEPKPAYTTVSTIIRILEKKGFVSYKAYGKTHEYYPLVSKKQYARSRITNLLGNYFGNSVPSLASFLTHEENLSLEELEEIRGIMDAEINKLKPDGDE
jgi:BlaI family transcriptional regulator, penicillinase repressor